MTIDELYIFVAVAQNLNFTQAAEQLHFSQPTLSRRISDLERELGRDLFVRTTRKVALTEFGKNFLVEARRLLKSYEQLQEQISNLGKEDIGSLSIGSPAAMTGSFLPSVIKRFSQKYPGVMIDVRIIEPGSCITLLKHNLIDLGFFASTDTDFSRSTAMVETVSTGELVLVTGLSHKLAACDVVSPEALAGERIYTSMRNNTPFLWATVTRYLSEHNLTSTVLEEIESPHAIAMLVEAGLGVTIMAENLLQELGNQEHLHVCHLDEMHHTSQLNVAWSKDSSNQYVPKFMNELHAILSEFH